MSMAATMNGQGPRPMSFLPSIKCSDCAEEIEIARMGEHVCGGAASPPPPTVPSHPQRPVQPSAPPAAEPSPKFNQQFNGSAPFLPPTAQPLYQYRAAPAPAPAAIPIPQTRKRAPTLNSRSGASQAPAPRPSRTAPPRINPETANQPFLAPQPPKRTDSPLLSPALSTISSNSSKPSLLRAQTSPPGRLWDRPPSDMLSANLDCAFPRFGDAGKERRPSSSKGRNAPGASDRASARGGLHQESRLRADDRAHDMGPRSPAGTSGQNVMSRMNTLKSGPFDSGRTKASRDERPPPMPAPSRQESDGSSAASLAPRQDTAKAISPERTLASVKRAPSRPERPAEDVLSPRFLNNLSAEPVEALPSTFSLSQPPLQPRSLYRSQTFPLNQEASQGDIHRTPSEPRSQSRDERNARLPYSTSGQSNGGARNDTRVMDAPPVPRPVQQHRKEGSHAPSMSGSSTVSSSSHSVSNSNSTSGPSPISSAASSVDALSPILQNTQYGQEDKLRVQGLTVRNPTKPGLCAEVTEGKQRSPPRNFARPMSPPDAPQRQEPPAPEPQRSTTNEPTRSATSAGRKPGRGPQWAPRQDDKQTSVAPPSRSNTAPSTEIQTHAPLHSSQTKIREYHPQKTQEPASLPQAGPNPVPAPQQQHQICNTGTGATRQPHPTHPYQSHQHYQSSNYPAPLRSRSPQPPGSTSSPPPPPIPTSPTYLGAANSSTPPRRPHTPSARPTCRGCSHQIEGKSIKAADGRLTGRWHKTCFVCRTCSSPFASSSFYVHKDQPYCEQHYHEVNGSLCAGCNRGIEGEYLETLTSAGGQGQGQGEGDRKFHPRCFVCSDPGCREVLRDEYFEIAGGVFCERHALAAMRGMVRTGGENRGQGGGRDGPGGLQAPGGRELRAERRTTRLMMM